MSHPPLSPFQGGNNALDIYFPSSRMDYGLMILKSIRLRQRR
jgi:hypothetical protein